MLTADVVGEEGEKLKPGDFGAIIHIHPRQEAYVVESMFLDGETAPIATVPPSQARSVTSAAITHARTLPAAVLCAKPCA